MQCQQLLIFFQLNDLLIFEVKEALDILFLKIHAMSHVIILLHFMTSMLQKAKCLKTGLQLKGVLLPFKEDKVVSTFKNKW